MVPVRLRPAMRLVAATMIALAVATLAPAAEKAPDKSKPRPAAKSAKSDKSKERAKSLAAVCSRLGAGQRLGGRRYRCGRRPGHLGFCRLGGRNGNRLLSRGRGRDKVESLKNEAKKKGLSQVRAVQGRSDDPGLPAASVDMAYLHYVYHHFAKPREMLRGIWRSLKPGGYLVVVDKQLGTLQEWVPEKIREGEHHWTSEATVVRQAREEGFAFAGLAEDCWHKRASSCSSFNGHKDRKTPDTTPIRFFPSPWNRAGTCSFPSGVPISDRFSLHLASRAT